MTDKREFETEISKYNRELYRYCFYKCGGDTGLADEAYSDVLLVLFEKWDKLHRGERFGAYIFKVAEKCVKATLSRRKLRHRRIQSLDAALAEGILTEETYFDRYFADDTATDEYIRLIECELSEDELALFRLRFIEKLPLTEVGARLGIPYPTARYRALNLEKKVRCKIKKIFSEKSYDL